MHTQTLEVTRCRSRSTTAATPTRASSTQTLIPSKRLLSAASVCVA
ncbi:hypothetical protein F383_11488 [Gossypium arboreum]|uniref:Uncharacterized protein n=1 Tax=Gossypium arboreum TaxID=29729 RepID=A0A0B0MG20_GOSAR|nr:hypothetical protein F383_11488 [Gossypium arboreum]